MSLVCLDVHYKHQRIVLLNLLHRTLRIQWVDNDFMMIEARFMRNRLSRISRTSRQLDGLWAMKCRRETNFSLFLSMNLFPISPKCSIPFRRLTPRSVAFAACCAFALGLGFPPKIETI